VRCWKPARKHATIQASPGTPGIAVTAVEFVETTLGLRLDISQRIKDTFAILPMRWMVERTFAWIGNYRPIVQRLWDLEKYSRKHGTNRHAPYHGR
jgi:hypothetical protein